MANNNIFPEGVEVLYSGRGYAYIKDIRLYRTYLPDFSGYNSKYLELYGFENKGGDSLFDDWDANGFLPKLEFIKPGETTLSASSMFSGSLLSYVSPFINFGNEVYSSNSSGFFWRLNCRFLILNEDLIFSGDYPLYFELEQRMRYLGKIKSPESRTTFFTKTEYSENDYIRYIGGFTGFKGKMDNSYSYPGINYYSALTPKSYVDIFNSLYDFKANGEAPTSEQGIIKLNPRAFVILKPEELAILTNKGWTIQQ